MENITEGQQVKFPTGLATYTVTTVLDSVVILSDNGARSKSRVVIGDKIKKLIVLK